MVQVDGFVIVVAASLQYICGGAATTISHF